jgi:hypothetical protein
MIVVADASVLVGELLRTRGRELFLRPALHVVVAEDQWSETEHELARRLAIMQSTGRLTPDGRRVLEQSVSAMIDTQAIEVVNREMYNSFEETARRRVPRDPQDWPTVCPGAPARRRDPNRRPRLPRLRLPDMDRRNPSRRAGPRIPGITARTPDSYHSQ